MRHCAWLILGAFIAGAGASCAREAPPQNPASTAPLTPAGRKEFVFKGKVESVNPAGKTLTVNGEHVEGWMGAMTMMYKADQDDVYTKVKPGDSITARVYDGIEDMLYDVQVIPSDGKASKE